MNCMEARRMIMPYVKGELSDRDLEQFLKHIEQCSDCMDELDIYFTVYRVMDILDTGEKHEYDFKKMLQDSIRMSKTRIFLGRIKQIMRGILICCAELLLVISIITGIQKKIGYEDMSVFHRVILKFQPVPEQTLQIEPCQESIEQLSEQIEELVRERNQAVWQKTLPQKISEQKEETVLYHTESE